MTQPSTIETPRAAAPPSDLHENLRARLQTSLAALWAEARRGRFWRTLTERGCSRELYRLTMAQFYHYTRHNSLNQAATAFRADPEQLALLGFVYEHAREELGHERLILRDLEAAGLWHEGEPLPPPLPATDALIHYLYGVALREGPIPRLGYSHWAESVYPEIAPLLCGVRESLALTDRDLTFFTAHAEIDRKHSRQVESAMNRAVTTAEQAEAVHRVAVTSLWLTLQLLEQACAAAECLPSGGRHAGS